MESRAPLVTGRRVLEQRCRLGAVWVGPLAGDIERDDFGVAGGCAPDLGEEWPEAESIHEKSGWLRSFGEQNVHVRSY